MHGPTSKRLMGSLAQKLWRPSMVPLKSGPYSTLPEEVDTDAQQPHLFLVTGNEELGGVLVDRALLAEVEDISRHVLESPQEYVHGAVAEYLRHRTPT